MKEPIAMSDKSQTPEAVAYDLYFAIANKEYNADNTINADRDYVLSLYAECMKATRGYHKSDKAAAEPRVRSLAL